MRTRKKLFPLLLLALLSLGGLAFYIFFINPQENFTVVNYFVSPIIFFFMLLFITIAGIGSFFLLSLRRGVLLGVFITTLLTLRLFGFTSFLYIGILLVIIILLELGFRKH